MFIAVLAIVTAAVCGVVAKPALPIPVNGKYRIQNANTGFFMDASGGSQGAGNAVIAQTLNQPLTTNQEWTVTLDDEKPSLGTLQSISSFIVVTSGANPVVDLNPMESEELLFVLVPGGVAICLNPQSDGCFTSPATPLTQIPVQPFTGALTQTWIFQTVGN